MAKSNRTRTPTAPRNPTDKPVAAPVPTRRDESTAPWGNWTPDVEVTPTLMPSGETGFIFTRPADSTVEFWRADLLCTLWQMMLLARAWGTPHFTPEDFGKGWVEHFKELVTTYGAEGLGFYITGLRTAILSDETLRTRFRDEWLAPLYWAVRFDRERGLDERGSAEIGKTLDAMWPLVFRLMVEAGREPGSGPDLKEAQGRLEEEVRSASKAADAEAPKGSTAVVLPVDNIGDSHQLPAYEFDAFLCHASEDKNAIVVPFARAMKDAGLRPWLDKEQVGWGENLVGKVQEGLSRSRCVVLFVSSVFLGKPWAETELNAAMSMEVGGPTRVLPILLGLPHDELKRRYPLVSPKLCRVVSDYDAGAPVDDVIIGELVRELKSRLGC
jgi:hypothetical protein